MHQLLEGSCVYSDVRDPAVLLAEWERSRRFITRAIDSPGSILDYGSANGFLLRSLQEWSDHRLVPFGIEIDEDRLMQAHNLYPAIRSHFARPDEPRPDAFPASFDYVYWAAGDNVDFRDAGNERWLREIMGLTAHGGRFILGLYDSRVHNQQKIADLTACGIEFSICLANPCGGDEVICWLDR